MIVRDPGYVSDGPVCILKQWAQDQMHDLNTPQFTGMTNYKVPQRTTGTERFPITEQRQHDASLPPPGDPKQASRPRKALVAIPNQFLGSVAASLGPIE